MKNWIKYKVNIIHLLLIFIILVSGLVLTEISKVKAPTDYSHLQYQAAQIMLESIEAIRTGREDKRIPINTQLDPNRTGLIGEEYTILTTTLGNLSAKRTSNLICRLDGKIFEQANLKAGDVIAVGSSGSFPALLLATFAACKATDITPIAIYARCI